MSKIYSQHTVGSVYVGPTGHQHSRGGEDDGHTPFTIECEACEPFLIREGWVYNPELVPLTDVQEREKDRITREGNMAVRQVAERLASVAAAELRVPEQDIVVMAPPLTKAATTESAKPKRALSEAQKAAMAAGRAAAKAKSAAKA